MVTFDYEGDAVKLITYTLNVTNEILPDEPDEPFEPPKTGDDSKPWIYAGVAGTALLVMLVLNMKRRKEIKR